MKIVERMNLSLEDIKKAFEEWETDRRTNPEDFLSFEEFASASVEEMSAQLAATLWVKLQQMSNEVPESTEP